MILMNDKDFKPMIMWFILVIGIIILTFVRINRMIGAWIEYKFNMDTIFACLYIFWMLIEFEISGKDVEEKTLFRIKEYAEFAKNRKRLFPWVW